MLLYRGRQVPTDPLLLSYLKSLIALITLISTLDCNIYGSFAECEENHIFIFIKRLTNSLRRFFNQFRKFPKSIYLL